jgi:plasmid stabilization system protein ParE
MRVVYTQGALSDLEDILGGLNSINPLAAAAVARSIGATVARVGGWPRSARLVAQWKEGNVRAVPLVRYPYVIFYQVKNQRIEILHVRHTSRAPWNATQS